MTYEDGMFIITMKDLCPEGKNRHNVGDAPNFHSNCFIVEPDAQDVKECPLCVGRAKRREAEDDGTLDAEIIGE